MSEQQRNTEWLEGVKLDAATQINKIKADLDEKAKDDEQVQQLIANAEARIETGTEFEDDEASAKEFIKTMILNLNIALKDRRKQLEKEEDRIRAAQGDTSDAIDKILGDLGLTPKEPPANAEPAPDNDGTPAAAPGQAAEPDGKLDAEPGDGLSDEAKKALESGTPPTKVPDAPADGGAPDEPDIPDAPSPAPTTPSPSNGQQAAPDEPSTAPSNAPQPAPAPAPTTPSSSPSNGPQAADDKPAKSSFFSGLFNYLGYPFHLGGKVAGSIAKLATNGYKKVLAPGVKFLRTHKWQALATVATGGLYGLYKLARTETVAKAAVKAFNVGKMPVVLAADIVTGKLQYKFYEKYVRGVLMEKLGLTKAGNYLNDKLTNTGRFVASIPVVGVPFRLLSNFKLPNLTPWLNEGLLNKSDKPTESKKDDVKKPDEPKPEDTAAALTPAAQAEKLEAAQQQAAGDKPTESKPTENKPAETKAAA